MQGLKPRIIIVIMGAPTPHLLVSLPRTSRVLRLQKETKNVQDDPAATRCRAGSSEPLVANVCVAWQAELEPSP